MSLQELSNYTFQSRYSQYNYEIGRKEVWDEAVERIFLMHKEKYASVLSQSQELRDLFSFAQEQYRKKRTLGSQRALQFGGEPILRNNARLYNCTGTVIDRSKAFQDIVYVLMSGCGAGYSVQSHHIEKLPQVKQRSSTTSKYIIPDTCEGWADAVGVLLSSYFVGGAEFPEYENKTVIFDGSQIRPKGALIAGRFKAPGPEPLLRGLKEIEKLIEGLLSQNINKLRPIDAHDIICFAANFVISAGVRRSALISLFDSNDALMSACKTGDWFIKNPQRARANNSAVIKRSEITLEQFKEIIENVRHMGEPGFYFVDDPEYVATNPCCLSSTNLVANQSGVSLFSNIQNNDIFYNGNLTKTNTGVFENGQKPIYRFYLEKGGYIDATEDHKVKTDIGYVSLSEAMENDTSVYFTNELASNINIDFSSDAFKTGVLLGLFYGDGSITRAQNPSAAITFWGSNSDQEIDIIKQMLADLKILANKSNKNTTKIGSRERCSVENQALFQLALKHKFLCDKNYTKQLLPDSLEGDWNYVFGVLSGLFSTDGSFNSHITFSSSDKLTVNTVSNVLRLAGIQNKVSLAHKSGLKKMPDGNGGLKEYYCKDNYTLYLPSNERFKLQNLIKLFSFQKQQEFDSLLNKKTNKSVDINSSKISECELLGVDTVYDISFPATKAFSCNGIDTHNCEIGFWPRLPTGETGVSFCNLTEINGGYCDTKEKFFEQCKASAIIGTLQAGYTDFPYLGNVTEEIVKSEALLGCSITGWMSNPQIFFDEEILTEGTKIIKEWNDKVSDIIGIRPAARLTCAKPAGTTSALLGTCSGIHPHHAKRYIRRVQSNEQDIALQFFEGINPTAVEQSVWNTNGTDKVISFLCEVEKGSIVKNQISAIEFLDKIKTAQKHWVLPGTVSERGLSPNITHNISNTCVVKDDEWDDVTNYLYENRDYFSGISLLPASGDLDYSQAPFSTVLTPNELIKEYGDACVFASGLIVDGLAAFNNNLWAACDCVMGIGEQLDNDSQEPEYPKTRNYKDLAEYFEAKDRHDSWFKKQDWIRRISQFADRYFEGDVRRATYCCKHVSLWKTWVDLGREYKEVDWTKMESGPEYKDADTLTAQACSGGACELK